MLVATSACIVDPASSTDELETGALRTALLLGEDPSWEQVEQHGDLPPPSWEGGVSFARSVHQPNVVHRFGGQDGIFPEDFTRNDFHALDLETFTWTDLGSAQTPGPRADTVVVPGPCGNCVSIVGGRGRFRTGADLMFPEMWTYHTQSHQWEAVPAEDLGDPLAVRRSSALVVTAPVAGHPNKTVTYVFGGVGNTLSRFATTPTGLRNDVAVRDPDTGWSTVATHGTAPAPRAWCAGGYDSSNHALLVLGGYRLGEDQGPDTPAWELFGPTNYADDLWSLDLATMTWTELDPSGPRPSPRDNAVAFFDAERAGLVVYGGQSFDGLRDDLWFYSVEDDAWVEVVLDEAASVPPVRVGGVFVVRQTATAYELYLHGGASSDGGASVFYDDLWRLRWPKA
ncbi:Kelch repeat-containing protein [Paraliomyxa miuraensis]|uniref:Kelch repeat-containing protein n=1 Tax=Paraliomyxa miuraensis TaxID=376150 RepID=UPI00225767AE|nr:kelch repeat-containing protein [Paraliomyxa miuraensis]MCX4243423.1 hypothetical protein [Paraliomyxa miuraensis]